MKIKIKKIKVTRTNTDNVCCPIVLCLFYNEILIQFRHISIDIQMDWALFIRIIKYCLKRLNPLLYHRCIIKRCLLPTKSFIIFDYNIALHGFDNKLSSTYIILIIENITFKMIFSNGIKLQLITLL